MEDKDKGTGSAFFPLPYTLVIQGENSIRGKEESWRFRVLTAIMRQSPTQIDVLKERYKNAKAL